MIMNCVVVSMNHSRDGLSLQLAAPLGDGNYVRMAVGEMASLTIAAPLFEAPVIAVADNRYIDIITGFLNSGGSPTDPKPQLRLVKS
jgi:hypothetical protein